MLLFTGLAASYFIGSFHQQNLEPLSSGDAGANVQPLPDDALVLTITAATEVDAPFLLREDTKAAGGIALVLPDGARKKESKEPPGRARLALNIPAAQPVSLPAASTPLAPGGRGAGGEGPQAEKFHAWARVRWQDSCGNSASLKIGDGAEVTLGNDSIYNTWHWVSAGQHDLAPGKIPVTIIEREDGVAIDQLLFTRDGMYIPTGPIRRSGEDRGIRRFADDFARSPGHGMEEWELLNGKWEIGFSFDPNRIPHQYALVGRPAGSPGDPADRPTQPPALALVRAAPWHGCRVEFSFSPESDGKYGVALDRSMDGCETLYAGFALAAGKARLEVEGCGLRESADLGDAVRLNQWHRIVVERWAWVTRISVDGLKVFENFAAAPRVGKAGFFVASGAAVFDDVEIEEIPWQADDGNDLHINWASSEGAKWFRSSDGENAPAQSGKTLIGREGSISTSLSGMGLQEAVIEDVEQEKGQCAVIASGLEHDKASRNPAVRIYRRPEGAKTPAPTAITLQASGEDALVRRVAFRYGEESPKIFRIGPYHFTEAQIEDASDYLDFTPEEYKKMAQSPDRDKLARQPKFKPLVDDPGEDNSEWIRERGYWRVANGVLSATGPGIVRHSRELSSDIELRCKLRFADPRAMAEVELYAGPEPGVRVQLASAAASQVGQPPPQPPSKGQRSRTPQIAAAPPSPGDLNLTMPGDDKWHELLVRVSNSTLSAALDKEPLKQIAVKRGDGGRMFLKVPAGRVEWDDVEFTSPRHTAESGLYPFQQREPEWWREGKWVDHGGISCVLASNWVSLMTPQGKGILWNKRTFGPDLFVGFDIEENSEWYGWHAYPSHVHHPFDNICVVLAAEIPAPDKPQGRAGYRLEVNAKNRTATILFRNSVEVARVAQDEQFPMKYIGGHGPYYPRRNHIALVKRGSLLRAIVNGKEVLRFDDPQPLDVSRAGVGGYNTHVNFGHIEVRQLEK